MACSTGSAHNPLQSPKYFLGKATGKAVAVSAKACAVRDGACEVSDEAPVMLHSTASVSSHRASGVSERECMVSKRAPAMLTGAVETLRRASVVVETASAFVAEAGQASGKLSCSHRHRHVSTSGPSHVCASYAYSSTTGRQYCKRNSGTDAYAPSCVWHGCVSSQCSSAGIAGGSTGRCMGVRHRPCRRLRRVLRQAPAQGAAELFAWLETRMWRGTRW